MRTDKGSRSLLDHPVNEMNEEETSLIQFGAEPSSRKQSVKAAWHERFLLLKENEQRYLTKAAGLIAGADEAGRGSSHGSNQCRAGWAGFVAGVDEAGRGPLAGPVVAAAVILPSDFHAERIDDSKRLTHSQRERLYEQISARAVSVSWALVSERVIDEAGILNATHIAMRDAVEALSVAPSLVLVDGRDVPYLKIPQAAFPKADGTFLSVAAASVVAKFVRDSLMADAHERFPQYGFNIHKGYGTRQHIEALLRYGPCRLHRFSFRPVKEIEYMTRASK